MDLLYFVPSASPEGSEDSAPSLVSSTLSGRSHLGAFSTIATVNDSDNEDDIDNDSDNDENTGYDLTAEELDIVARRASDRSLGTEERAEAALLLFGMAGCTCVEYCARNVLLMSARYLATGQSTRNQILNRLV